MSTSAQIRQAIKPYPDQAPVRMNVHARMRDHTQIGNSALEHRDGVGLEQLGFLLSSCHAGQSR